MYDYDIQEYEYSPPPALISLAHWSARAMPCLPLSIKAVNSLANSAVPFCTQEFLKAKELKSEERRVKEAQRDAITASRGSGSKRVRDFSTRVSRLTLN